MVESNPPLEKVFLYSRSNIVTADDENILLPFTSKNRSTVASQ